MSELDEQGLQAGADRISEIFRGHVSEGPEDFPDGQPLETAGDEAEDERPTRKPPADPGEGRNIDETADYLSTLSRRADSEQQAPQAPPGWQSQPQAAAQPVHHQQLAQFGQQVVAARANLVAEAQQVQQAAKSINWQVLQQQDPELFKQAATDLQRRQRDIEHKSGQIENIERRLQIELEHNGARQQQAQQHQQAQQYQAALVQRNSDLLMAHSALRDGSEVTRFRQWVAQRFGESKAKAVESGGDFSTISGLYQTFTELKGSPSDRRVRVKRKRKPTPEWASDYKRRAAGRNLTPGGLEDAAAKIGAILGS